MSKVINVQLQIYDDDVLKQALDELGIPWDNDPPASWTSQNKEEVESKLWLKQHNVAMMKSKGEWSVKGESYNVNRVTKTVKPKIDQIYAVKKVEKEIKKLGCVINKREKTQGGQVKIKVLVP